jgi:hypothetical protein
MARVVKKKDRNPYKPGVQAHPPKARKVKTKTPAKPGTPGALALNPDQMLEYGDRMSGFNDELSGLNTDVADVSSQLPKELEDINRGFTHARDSEASDMSSRGIFESSIRDIQLADLNAQQALQEQAANGVVEAAKRTLMTRTSQINGVGGERERTQQWADNSKVQNASDNTTAGTPATSQTQVDRDPGKPGIQNRPPQAVSVNVRVGGPHPNGGQGRARPRGHRPNPHGDPYARH